MEKYDVPEENSLDSMERRLDKVNQIEKFEYFFFPDEKQRMLLGEAMEGVIDVVAESNNIGDVEKAIIPSVIFLDKSARPLSTLFRDLWRKKFSDSADLNISFLNFGREIVKYEEEKGEVQIVNTNDYYLAIWKDKIKNSFLKYATQGSVITIVDDIKNTGATEKSVVNFLEEMFPHLQFKYIALTNAYKGGRPATQDNLNNLELFESIRESSMEGRHLSKKPSWMILKQGIEELNGLTGVMDEGDSHGFRHKLTALSYRKHKYFSPEERERREKEYLKNKERMDKVFGLIQEFANEIVLWAPVLTDKDFDEIAGLKDGLISFKRETQNLLNLIKQKEQKGYKLFLSFESFANSFTDLCDLNQKIFNNQDVKREIFDRLGIKEVLCEGRGFGFSDTPEGNILAHEDSIAGKIIKVAKIVFNNHYDVEYRFDKQSIERRADELVPQLRDEMHHIADEYWSNKLNTNNQ